MLNHNHNNFVQECFLMTFRQLSISQENSIVNTLVGNKNCKKIVQLVMFQTCYCLPCCYRLDLEVEPIFASMALYDGRVKKKVSCAA